MITMCLVIKIFLIQSLTSPSNLLERGIYRRHILQTNTHHALNIADAAQLSLFNVLRFHGIDFLTYIWTLRIRFSLMIWILVGYYCLGTGIIATFTACYCHHYFNDKLKSLYQ